MNLQFGISKKTVERFFSFNISKLYMWEKRSVATLLFYSGMVMAYFCSLHPWFLWPLGELYPIPVATLLLVAYLVSNSMKEPILNRHGFLYAIFFYTVLSFYLVLSQGMNVNGYIVNFFTPIIFFVLMKADSGLLSRLSTVIAKCFAVILIPSILFFVLYILGLPLPGVHAVYGENLYDFTNYYFFMIDDRFMMVLIPRFQSVFLEPGHLGSATTVLLMTQFGKWKKWWNIVLFIATFMSFSLAAYAIIIAIVFLKLWVERQNLIGKMVIVMLIIATVAVVATFYNDGDNMVNNLILARLEINDATGEMEGNNRVTADFEDEFNKYILNSDVFFGRDMSKIAAGSGNSGYRVWIYQNGLVGLFLLICFYTFSFWKYTDSRQLLMVVSVSLLIFWIRGYPLWYSNFIPLFIAVNQNWIKQRSSVIYQ